MKPLSYTNSLNLEIAPGGDLSNVGKSIRATSSSQASTITTFITTGTTITSAAISGPKSSSISSITPSSANNVSMSSTLSTYNDVDKGIEFSMIDPKYQQNNEKYLTDMVTVSPQNSAHYVGQNGCYSGPLLNTGAASTAINSLKTSVDSIPELQQTYPAVSSILDKQIFPKCNPIMYSASASVSFAI